MCQAHAQLVGLGEITRFSTYLHQSLHSTCNELAVWAELGYSDRSFEAEMVQQHLPLAVDEQSFALCVNGKQKHAIGAEAKCS